MQTYNYSHIYQGGFQVDGNYEQTLVFTMDGRNESSASAAYSALMPRTLAVWFSISRHTAMCFLDSSLQPSGSLLTRGAPVAKGWRVRVL